MVKICGSIKHAIIQAALIRGAKKTERWGRIWYAIEKVIGIPHKKCLKKGFNDLASKLGNQTITNFRNEVQIL